jgi:hypothetical protein
MAATHDLINSTDAAITGWGGSAVNVPARTISVAATLTDAQAILGEVNAGAAVMKASSTAAQQQAVAGMLLDATLVGLDLSTPQLREYNRLKMGVDEAFQALRAICS